MARTAAFHPEKSSKATGSSFDSEKVWAEKPEIIRLFLDRRSNYEKLCAEVAYILNRELNKSEIEFSTITYRAKTLDSFLEKIQRKGYADPINEVTDLAGVRVVCLYVDDLPKLEEIVRAHFETVDKVDLLTDKRSDGFGYGAIHFVVRLGEKSSGARYDDLKDLVCEIQTRTVLQDAWAIIDHHLVYKNESSIPSVLRSRLNDLAQNFEQVDDEFKNIRSEREDYLTDIERSKESSESFLENELNLDSFIRYAQWKFPEVPTGTKVLDVPFFLKPLNDLKIGSLSELDTMVEKGKEAYEFYLAKNGRDFLTSYSITSVALSVLLINRDYMPEHIKQLFPKYSEFIEKNRF